MLNVKSALRQILNEIRPGGAVSMPLLKCLGCLLAEDIISQEALPPFSNSSMDGYAVRSNDFLRGKKIFRMADAIAAGTMPTQNLKSGFAAPIMTGAPIPSAADAVIPIEQSKKLPDGFVNFFSAPEKNQYVRLKGEEIQRAEKIISRGKILQPADLGLLSSIGRTTVKVIPKPTLSILTTGSEIVDPSVVPKPGQIRNANLTALTACAQNLGVPVISSRHVKDDALLLEQAFSECQSDVILTCGAVSVGEYDFVKPVLAKMGKIYFWKVAIKPGKPFVFGKIGRAYFFGLPGNPVSALVTFEILVKPALLALSGRKKQSVILKKAKLTEPIEHEPGRLEYVRARVLKNGKNWTATPLPWQGSSMLRSLTQANAWIVVPQNSASIPAGNQIRFLSFLSEES